MNRIALIGMPNVGKTALFNKLTNSSERIANFSGVTVEIKSSEIILENQKFELIDYPGLYSIDAVTLEEKITQDFLLDRENSKSADSVLLVLDSTQMQKCLFLAMQLKELGINFIMALNMSDEAKKRGQILDLKILSEYFQTSIVEVSAASGEGLVQLKSELLKLKNKNAVNPKLTLKEINSVERIKKIHLEVDDILNKISITKIREDKFTKKVDSILLHPVLGLIIMFFVLFSLFQALYSWAAPFQDGIEFISNILMKFANENVSHPIIASLISDGIIAGVTGILVFLPQILILFLFIQVLEDVGYLGRITFLMDGLMRRFGLPGKAVIPLLSSHACNIPGIMSTRILDNPKERLITMMVIPLTTCSARIPVYVMLIGALAPADKVFGIFNTAGVILFGLYVFSMFMTVAVAYVLKKILKVKRTSMLLMELPSYHIPQFKNLWKTIVFQSKTFLTKVGSVVVVLSICIWILVSFPMKEDGSVSEIENSYAANIGKSALVIFKPLGFDWKITTALIPSFAAREVLVSSLATVLAVDANENHSEPLSESMKTLYSVPTLIALLVWFMFSPQCISTFGVIKRETKGYKWPIIIAVYTLTMSYIFSYLAYNIFSVFY